MFVESILISLFIFNIALIILIYSYNPAGTINRFLSLLLIPITLTNVAILFLYTAQQESPVEVGLNIAIWSVIFFFPLFYHFSFYFPRKRITRKKYSLLVTLYIAPVIIGILNIISIGFHPNMIFFNRLFPLRTPTSEGMEFYFYHFLMLIYILILLFLTSRRLIRSFRLPLLKRERRTLLLILIGFIPLSFFILFNYLLFYPLKWGIYLFLSASTAHTVFFIFLLLQFGFIERKALTRVFIVYPMVIVGLFLLYRFLLQNFNASMVSRFNINQPFLISIEILIFFSILSPFTRFLEHLLGSIALPIKENFHQALRESSSKLVHIINLHELDRFLSRLFFYELNVRKFFFLIRDDNTHKFHTVRRFSDGAMVPEFSEHGELIRKLNKEKKVMDIQQLSLSWSRGKELNLLDYYRITLVIPLFEKNNLVGVCLLGEPGFAQTWHPPEIEALELFSSSLAITIARCKIHRRALEMEKRQANIEKMTVLNELTSGVAHEIRNPLSIISTSAETIANKELSQTEVKKLALYIQEETKRMSQLLDKILASFSSKNDLQNASTDISAVISHTFELISSQARKKNIGLRSNCGQYRLMVNIDWAALAQICLNITLNAIEATPEDGEIEARIEERGDKAYVFFINDGTPIPKEVGKQIFNPFFTTKPNGTGLGLSVSKRLATDVEGSLRLLSNEARTCFELILPKAEIDQSKTAGSTLFPKREMRRMRSNT